MKKLGVLVICITQGINAGIKQPNVKPLVRVHLQVNKPTQFPKDAVIFQCRNKIVAITH